ncbi:uncharacterized protein LACBIDRAFT_189781 [Laccaria bicolor S238N-H82]|uniref:Predicted protein n=1 Tax=Laccaria bicolor (strain S238N-H82 / ATCC MYA-4686) TaxID=486041 RepID=B0D6J7_LACBS|nr:uncharacterized protein LACBIDRAFT_189781 [Laccaria bicolor S238N-H82]EDR09968.1 predicted protein [Laccaria bicolor S238N-H82]|eukprot:XP_001879353.1 predicted protein [Laccaria bicolor S238N-H82]
MVKPTDYEIGPSRIVSGRYPPPGTNTYADAIRERRGARGITALDGNLLHFPAMAGGYNTLLGAIRDKGSLSVDIRELMILRVAALNNAAFEWIQHEAVGRKGGLTNGQLYIIRDVDTPLPLMEGILTPLQAAAVAFTDAITKDVSVPKQTSTELMNQLRRSLKEADAATEEEELKAKTEDLYVEATMVVAAYNMVSRFLVATDVGGLSDLEVPWPVDVEEQLIPTPSYPSLPFSNSNSTHSPASGTSTTQTHNLHIRTITTSPTAPWLVFANSLLTDKEMWNLVLPFFLDGGTGYNILLHSQRGHGLSELPSQHERRTTIPLLAADIHHLISTIIGGRAQSEDGQSHSPEVHIIGVSQGGAAALAYYALYGSSATEGVKVKSIVACDTAPRTPPGNEVAWENRISIALDMYARKVGMPKLAKVTLRRWFPAGSGGSPFLEAREAWLGDMVSRTPVAGFVAGARALGSYDIALPPPPSPLPPSPLHAEAPVKESESDVTRVLLLAGSLDGAGKVGKELKAFAEHWADKARQEVVEYAEVEMAGHLPMVDMPERFCKVLGAWLVGEGGLGE